METKVCTKCGKELPLTAEYFRRDNTKRIGFSSHCKDCKKKADKKWHNANRIKKLIKNINYRAKPEITETQLESILDKYRDNNGILHCIYCDREIKEFEMLNIEHFIPVIKGGQNTSDNLIPACRYCNRSKFDEDFVYWFRNQLFYSREREISILEQLGYNQDNKHSTII